MPNRQHYLKAAMIGGGAAALLSVFPLTFWLNMFFSCLVIAGGVLAVQNVQSKTGTVETGEAGIIGALSGVACGLFLFMVGFCGFSLLGVIVLPDASRHNTEEFMTMFTIVNGAMCCSGVTMYPMLGAVGGFIGGMIWPAQKAGAGAGASAPGAVAGAPGVPARKPEPTPEEREKRKKMIRIALGTVGGCLALMAGLCGFGFYLAYLESRDPDDTAGEEAVVETPLTPGEPATFEIAGTGSYETARYGIWLVADDDLPDSLAYSLEGRMGCHEVRPYGGSEPNLHSIYSYHGPDDGEPSWMYLDSEYAWSGDPMRCAVMIESLPPGVSNPRIVVTKLSRPSDWFD